MLLYFKASDFNAYDRPTDHLHAAEDEAVLVREMVSNEVVEVEDSYLEDGIVGTDADIGHRQNGSELEVGNRYH